MWVGEGGGHGARQSRGRASLRFLHDEGHVEHPLNELIEKFLRWLSAYYLSQIPEGPTPDAAPAPTLSEAEIRERFRITEYPTHEATAAREEAERQRARFKVVERDIRVRDAANCTTMRHCWKSCKRSCLGESGRRTT